MERSVLAALTSAYTEDELGGESRVYLKFPKAIAPIKAVSLSASQEQARACREGARGLLNAQETGPANHVGRQRQYRQALPPPGRDRARRTASRSTSILLVRILELLDTVTLRDRDTGAQERIALGDLLEKIRS